MARNDFDGNPLFYSYRRYMKPVQDLTVVPVAIAVASYGYTRHVSRLVCQARIATLLLCLQTAYTEVRSSFAIVV